MKKPVLSEVEGTEGGQTVLYVNQYFEKNLSTSEVTTHYYLGGKEIVFKKGSTLEYLHTDHLGSTSVTTNTSGTTVSTVKYFPFGGARSQTGTLDTDKRFTGQRLDQTGLYYYGARYYDATIGRFISPDTIVPNPANPQSLNRYSYCLNNPLKYIDPSGHQYEYITEEKVNQYCIDNWDNPDAPITDAGREYGRSERPGPKPCPRPDPAACDGSGFSFSPIGWIQGGLDAIGLVCELADGLNALIYVARGDWENAAISGAAILPVVGDTGKAYKYGKKAIDAVDSAKDALKVTDEATMLGAKDTRTPSTTVWKGKSGGRIDVENPSPGNRPGQIHYQDSHGNKYMYDPTTGTFPDGPRSVNDLLKDHSFNAGIQKAMKYLGE